MRCLFHKFLNFQFPALIPSPIYFGALFDSSCKLWYSDGDCGGRRGEKGVCHAYDVTSLPRKLFGLCAGLKAMSFCLLVALVADFEFGPAARLRRHKKNAQDSNSTNTTASNNIDAVSISYSGA